MNPIANFCRRVEDSIPSNGVWNPRNAQDVAFDPTQSFSSLNHIYQDRLTLELAEISAEPTSLSVHGSIDQQGGQTMPFDRTWDPANNSPPVQARGYDSSLIQNKDSRTSLIPVHAQGVGGNHSLSRPGGMRSPLAVAGEQDMVASRDEGTHHGVRVIQPSALTMPPAWEISSGQGFGNVASPQEQHLLIEPRYYGGKWHCPFCDQRLKRRDYVKQHVRRKHPQRLYSLPSLSSKQSNVPSAHHQYAQDELLVSGFFEYEGTAHLIPSWHPDLGIHAPSSFQYDTSSSGIDTPPSDDSDTLSRVDLKAQKRPHGTAFPTDGGVLSGSTIRPSKRVNTIQGDLERPFACPFSKNNPIQHRKCLGLSLRRLNDVKQHIYRSHTKPEYYCANCYVVFQTATDRDVHSRQRVCERRDGPSSPQFQGVTESQRKALREKLPRELDVEEQWFKIYATVFPGSEKPKSAYVGNCWEDIVALIRKRWHAQGHNIMKHTKGDESRSQLISAIDFLLQGLECPCDG